MEITREIAKIICEMEVVCEGEGIGPSGVEVNTLFGWIAQTYPDLKEEYKHLYAWEGK